MAQDTLPLPPSDLAVRVGTVEGAEPFRFYLDEGSRLHDLITELLPAGWDWEGKRALDFGCGSARVLRHFASEAARGTLWGCDIDAASIAWDAQNLSPPFQFFRNGLAPPLTLPPRSLDLIWAMSVFTHITDSWSDWLAEMHRLLAPGGVLVASFLGEGMWPALVGEPYVEDEVGMTVMHHWEGPDAWVFHSEWWLREHWGRGFDVLSVRRPPLTADATSQITHSYIAVQRRDVAVSSAELERIDPAEPRELAGVSTSLRIARTEQATLAARLGRAPGALDRLRPRAAAAVRGASARVARHRRST
jgi:SAM-dependent methyltransferase